MDSRSVLRNDGGLLDGRRRDGRVRRRRGGWLTGSARVGHDGDRLRRYAVAFGTARPGRPIIGGNGRRFWWWFPESLVENRWGDLVLRLSNLGCGPRVCFFRRALVDRVLIARAFVFAIDVLGSLNDGGAIGYSFRYSRSRRVCVRLTGISVAFASFIRRR